MEDKKGNIVLGIILAILMIVAVVIVIKNPNKTDKIIETVSENKQEETNAEDKTSNTQEQNTSEQNIKDINKQEEKETSMQVGGTFCKIENQAVFYEDTNQTIYLYNVNENKTSKLATLENKAKTIYFDGENVYYIPDYYSGKGIYKIDLKGNIEKINEGSSLQLWLTEDKIYFVKQIGYDEINGNPQGTLCSMDKNGENIVEIAQNIKNDFFIQDEKIYYTTQDRKMYVIDINGENQKELVQGRKFVIATSPKYIVYIDYASQEAKHILSIETQEDKIIGYFGQLKKFQGKTYLNVRTRLDDGSLDTEYTLFEIKDDGTTKEYGKYANFGTDIKYIIDDKAYLKHEQETLYTVNLKGNPKEDDEKYKDCKYFVGGYGYKIDTSDIENIKIERIEL